VTNRDRGARFLSLTKCIFAHTWENSKIADEALMKEILEDIRNLLNDGSFQDEQHVRFSLVGRICQNLGWNIWNPQEFYTEFRVKRIPQQNLSKDVTGRVDIALFIPEKTSEGAEVFIEVKTAGRLDSDLAAGEMQLHLYNAYHKSAISILTDGIKWRFYLPSAGGEFEDKLFSEINLLEDDPDWIVRNFEMILRKDNYRKQALDTAESMRKELIRIKMIEKVKSEALLMQERTGLSQYMFAQQIIKKNDRVDIDINEIERLWNRKVSVPGPSSKPVYHSEILDSPYLSIRTEVLKDYAFKKVHYIIICGFEKIEVSSWRLAKREVYNYLIRNKPGLQLPGALRYTRDKSEFREALVLDKGYYTESNLSSTDLVRHSRNALKAAGYDPERDLVIAYSDLD
jgi:predicted type IV restriction endonuclease